MPNASTDPRTRSLEPLRELYYAHYRFQYLSAACQFGLFELLGREPGLTRAEIAVRLEIEEQPARILLLGCTSAGLLRKEDDRYFNSPVSEPLAGKLDDVPAAFVPWEQHINYRPMAWFYESLKAYSNVGLQREIPGDSPTLYGRLALDSQQETVFHNMMGSVSRLVAEELVEHLDLSGYTHLLDIGGGTAVNATHLARRWPHLRITIADLPTVAERANEKIASLGLSDRVRAIGLDVFEDEFPQGCDAVLFGHFLEIWSIERNKGLIAKAARAVEPGAGIFVVTPEAHDDDTGPDVAAALSAYFLTVASGEGMVYTCREYEEWFSEVGFEPSGRLSVGIGDAVITGTKR
ncbi:O-methyltransferase [Streptomyces lincolnensis]|uniref:O-methyltransferase n=1 Tax=Streptomyces lincolnensis TaxID=1915 RepID=A0A1B1MGD0_STRLN|nr:MULTISPECIES: methyltransferase [Streptomyces]ANS67669.1 O-methyltransferase [Streptomyces lincolnensis]QMV09332.1 methyltransferase [Streptomyces lincolnensis]WLW52480.1 methyltransferase [Streptomyces coralus]